MTDDVEKSYRNLLKQISNHTEWEYSDSNSYSKNELAKRSVNQLGPEAVYDSTDTEGQIILGPGSQSNLTGRLVQPLANLELDPNPGTFAAKVAEAYEGISASHIDDNEYLAESIRDRNPSDVLVLDIPLNSDCEDLDKALDATKQVSREVQELHNDIDQALSSRIDS